MNRLGGKAIEAFDRCGTLWIENLLAPRFVDDLHDAFADRYARQSQEELERRYAKVGDQRYMITVKVKPPFDSVALSANPTLMPLLEHFLGEDCVISSFGTVVSFPGGQKSKRTLRLPATVRVRIRLPGTAAPRDHLGRAVGGFG